VQLETWGCVTDLAGLEMSDEMATSGFKQGAASSGPNSVARWELVEFDMSACLNNLGRRQLLQIVFKGRSVNKRVTAARRQRGPGSVVAYWPT